MKFLLFRQDMLYDYTMYVLVAFFFFSDLNTVDTISLVTAIFII